jgi:hypothetical protein
MKTLGAYYQCYKNRTCVNFVIENFRKKYPQTTIFLICDGGKDFTEESKKYNCIYEYADRAYTQDVNLFKTFESMEKHILRFSNIDKIDQDFFIILEDDVFIKKEIDLESLKYDINGCNKNEFFKDGISSIIRQRNEKLRNVNNIYYGAFGGCVLNTAFFKSIFQNREKLNKDLSLFYQNCNPEECAADIILSYLCLINNGTIGHYDGLCETWYSDYEEREKSGDIEVLHHYKKYY